MRSNAVTAALALLVVLCQGPASATRVVGDMPSLGSRAAEPPPPLPQASTGVVTALRSTHPRGTEVQIDGRWWLVLRGRTSVLRNGRLLDEGALAVGQNVRYAPATLTPGETALGFLQVP